LSESKFGLPCTSCGVLQGNEELDNSMWSIYHRIEGGRSHYEPLVFTSDWLQENVQDDEDHAAVMHAMEKDMANRGLCPKCGRPNLTGVKEDDIMSEKDAQDMADMYAEQAAERRAGC
jgi:hypothetical protein